MRVSYRTINEVKCINAHNDGVNGDSDKNDFTLHLHYFIEYGIQDLMTR